MPRKVMEEDRVLRKMLEGKPVEKRGRREQEEGGWMSLLKI